jgi:hypothetical protein
VHANANTTTHDLHWRTRANNNVSFKLSFEASSVGNGLKDVPAGVEVLPFDILGSLSSVTANL